MDRVLRTRQRPTTRVKCGDLARAGRYVLTATLAAVLGIVSALGAPTSPPSPWTSQVTDQAGKPAAGATVVLAVAGSQVVIMNGKLHVGHGFRVKMADQAGRFGFPRQDGDFWFVMMHPAGYAQVKCSPKSVPKTIQLAPWARVEGTYRVAREPQENVTLWLNHAVSNGGAPNEPWIVWQSSVNTDAKGRYVFDRAVPGYASLGRDVRLDVNQGAIEMASAAKILTRLTAGQTTRIDFGASGRPVIGHLKDAVDSKQETPWNFAYIRVAPFVRAFQRPTFTATTDREGNFCIDDVPPGNYILSVFFPKNRAENLSEHRFTVPGIDEKLSQRPVDLGVLTLEPSGPVRVMAAPAKK